MMSVINISFQLRRRILMRMAKIWPIFRNCWQRKEGCEMRAIQWLSRGKCHPYIDWLFLPTVCFKLQPKAVVTAKPSVSPHNCNCTFKLLSAFARLCFSFSSTFTPQMRKSAAQKQYNRLCYFQLCPSLNGTGALTQLDAPLLRLISTSLGYN